jgi:uncharacterized membrane protein HdeD (DUF308 family)
VRSCVCANTVLGTGSVTKSSPGDPLTCPKSLLYTPLTSILGRRYVLVRQAHPGDTFLALAAVISFFLVFAGTSDIITAISARHEIEVWWLQLVGGIIELGLGFWAAGYYGRSAVLLVAWVASFAIIRGVRDIVLAFRIRQLQHSSSA